MKTTTLSFRFLQAAMLIFLVAFSSTAFGQWSKYSIVNSPVCNSAYEQLSPNMVSDGDGGSIITWYDKRNNNDFDIYAQRIDAFGKILWTNNGVAVCMISSDQINPVITSDGSGGAIIAWLDARNGSEIYAQKLDENGVRQWDTSGVLICSAGGDKYNLKINSDFNGGAILAWEDNRNGYDIIGQRINTNGDLEWNSDGLEICVADNDQTNVTLTSDGDSGILIAWQDHRNGKKILFDIYSQKIDLAGNFDWNTDGNQICSTGDDQINPCIVSDDSGGAIIAWQDKRGGAFDIYVQRIDAGGTCVWTVNGNAICTSANDQTFPCISKDGAGGVIISWLDMRTSGANHIYAQRVNIDGSIAWTGNGLSVCSASGSREQPRILSDGRKGAFISWSDNRSGNYDVFVQRINSSGIGQWTTNGFAISTAANDQTENSICSDGYGGVLFSWADTRTSGNLSDIWSQNISIDGNMGIVPEIYIEGNHVVILDNDITPNSNDFTDLGSVKTFIGLSRTFRIFNSGIDTLRISSIGLSGTNSSNFSVQTYSYPKNISPRDSLDIMITYTPTSIGISNAILTINNNDSNEAIYNFSIRATFKAPKIEVKGNNTVILDGDMNPSSSDSTNFGNARLNQIITRTFIISSAGTDTLSISNISLSGTHSSEFSFSTISFPRKLNAGKTMNLSITFSPKALGQRVAVLTVISNDPAINEYDFAITGNSIAPEVSIKGNNKIIIDGDNTPALTDFTDFGKVGVYASKSRTFKIFNTGTDSLQISSISIIGSYSANYTVSNNLLPKRIASSDSFSFSVLFIPTVLGDHNAQLLITTDDDDESNYDFAIKGTGISPEIAIEGNHKSISSGNTTSSLSNHTDFGQLKKNTSKQRRFTIKNFGTDTLRITGISISGTDAALFSKGNIIPSAIIRPGDSSYFDLSFAPNSNGIKSATVLISSNDLDEFNYSFAVSGMSVSPIIELKGNAIHINDGNSFASKLDGSDFDSVEINQTLERNFVIYNNGNDSLKISSISISGTDASLFLLQSISLPSIIAPGETLMFTIRYAPVAIGIHQAKVTVLSNDGDINEYDFTLRGIGFKTIVNIQDELIFNNIKVYPNPTSAEINIDLCKIDFHSVELTVYSIDGKVVIQEDMNNNQIIHMDISALSPATYILRIKINGLTINKMIEVN